VVALGHLEQRRGHRVVLQRDVRERQHGAIINISSLLGQIAWAIQGAYCASKFALTGLTQQLALEVARFGIRVNCIAPGSHDTEMMDSTIQRSSDNYSMKFEEFRSQIKDSIPLGRQGQPSELAAAVSFVAGGDASFVTGQTLNVDGGSFME